MKTDNAEQSNTETKKPERRYEIDWLRVLGMLTVFCFRCARFLIHGVGEEELKEY